VDAGFSPWLSSIDIEAGVRWENELTQVLSSSRCGIFCLTPDALNSSWVAYEAGAIATRKKGKIFPYIIGMDAEAVKGPLSAFQACASDRLGTVKLVRGLVSQVDPLLPPEPLAAKVDEQWREFGTFFHEMNERASAACHLSRTNLLDRDGLFSLLELYFETVARELTEKLVPHLKDLDKLFLDRDDANTAFSEAQSLLVKFATQHPNSSAGALAHFIGTSTMKGQIATLIVDACTVIVNSRQRLKPFRHPLIQDIPAFLSQRFPALAFAEHVLTAVRRLWDYDSESRITAVYPMIRLAQAELRKDLQDMLQK